MKLYRCNRCKVESKIRPYLFSCIRRDGDIVIEFAASDLCPKCARELDSFISNYRKEKISDSI